jgi:ferredoxin
VSLRRPATAAELDAARRAALACPERAIRIEEAG